MNTAKKNVYPTQVLEEHSLSQTVLENSINEQTIIDNIPIITTKDHQFDNIVEKVLHRCHISTSIPHPDDTEIGEQSLRDKFYKPRYQNIPDELKIPAAQVHHATN